MFIQAYPLTRLFEIDSARRSNQQWKSISNKGGVESDPRHVAVDYRIPQSPPPLIPIRDCLLQQFGFQMQVKQGVYQKNQTAKLMAELVEVILGMLMRLSSKHFLFFVAALFY